MYNKLSKEINFGKFDSHKAFEIPIDPRRREPYFHLNKTFECGEWMKQNFTQINKNNQSLYFLNLKLQSLVMCIILVKCLFNFVDNL